MRDASSQPRDNVILLIEPVAGNHACESPACAASIDDATVFLQSQMDLTRDASRAKATEQDSSSAGIYGAQEKYLVYL